MTQYLKNYLKHDQVIFLSADDVLKLYNHIVNRYGGSNRIRDLNLLESAVNQPKLLLQYKRCDIFDLAAAYCFYIIKNHPFIDGNKRTGLISALTFLDKNNINTDYEFESLYQLTLGIADSSFKLEDIAQFLREARNE